ncbi:helix-turn-helix transcriptional regulator [Bacillus sp. FSL M8-0168]|uniref:helix-turn-helix transcriptional regulator n=1 Tax=Bacillus sp. FSL M8-0168 TaxID=2921614 RepID=UPI004049EF8C
MKENFNGEELRKKRKKKKLTQKELGKLVNVSDSYISKIELGNSIPSLKLLNKISVVLGSSIKDFFCS